MICMQQASGVRLGRTCGILLVPPCAGMPMPTPMPMSMPVPALGVVLHLNREPPVIARFNIDRLLRGTCWLGCALLAIILVSACIDFHATAVLLSTDCFGMLQQIVPTSRRQKSLLSSLKFDENNHSSSIAFAYSFCDDDWGSAARTPASRKTTT
ncbi:unnamed protein product, partial [Pylaiella littoralis]